MSFQLLRGLAGAAALLCASASSAHVVLERSEAQADAPYRAVLRVPHGCKGSPTTAIRVSLPEGAVGARPMAKPGWSIETVRGPYKKAYPGPHGTLSEGVREIAWTGGRLPDDFFDEFVFQVRLSDDFQPGETVHFPVEQSCETGGHRWVEIPQAGQDAHDLAQPAPGVRIVLAQAGGAPAVTKAGDLAIEKPWLRATPGGAQVAGGYVRVTNRGSAPDRLVGTSIPLAERGEVHEMSNENGVMKMRPVEGIAIAPGASIELKPGGFHLMFLGLKSPLKQGQRVKGTLVFERAGSVDVTFDVGAMGARSSGGGHHHH
jgi:uncharacterized protein YcnI